MNSTHALSTCTKSGSYQHIIVFKVRGDRVKVVETMHDDLMGDWMGHSKDRTISRAEARDYYRDRVRFGYRPLELAQA